MRTIAYLGPEVPATSATFIYEEILDLRRLGLKVLPFSVRRPTDTAEDPAATSLRLETLYLYEQPARARVAAFGDVLVHHPMRTLGVLGTLLHDGLRVGVLSMKFVKLIGQFSAGCLLAVRLEKGGAEHLHVHFAHVPTQIGMYAARLAAIPFTFTAHANDLFRRALLLREKGERARAVVAISEYNRDFLVEHGVDPAKIVVVRCGVSLPAMVRRDDGGRRQQVGVPVVGSLARLVEKKGMDTLLHACALVLARGGQLRLEIAGTGPLEKRLRDLVRELALDECVRFLGGLRHDKALEWLGQLDLFALACRKDSGGDMDGIPVVLMEAMACGTPVVSTRISGIPELIQHGVSGLLSEAGSQEGLAANIVRMLCDSDLRARTAAQARRRIGEEFSRETATRRMLTVVGG